MTAKEIYAMHGIEYKAGKILYRGRWIPELLKEGNSKTGKRVYTWSMTPGENGTCVFTCEGCYAMTGFYKMDNVKASLALNQSIVENDIEFFYNAISAQLEIIGSGEIRIHAAGDFNTSNSEEYANTWKRLVIENPSFSFGRIRKSASMKRCLTIQKTETLSNLSLMESDSILVIAIISLTLSAS